MSGKICVFVAHGVSRETVRLQPWRYLYELAVRKSENSQVVLITDASGSEREENWTENLKIVFSGLLSVKRRKELVAYINNLGAGQVWWSTTPRSIVYSRSWNKLTCPVTALITCPLYPWWLLIRARLSGVPKEELRALFLQRMIPRFFFVRLLNMACVKNVFVQSQANRSVLVQSGVTEAKVAVVPVGIDPADRKQLPAEKVFGTRRGYAFPEEAVVFTYMGAVRKIRGIDVLLSAFAKAALRSGNICLVILARGADEQTCGQLKEKCRTLGLNGRARIIGGWLTREQVWENIEACDVVTLPFVVVPSDVPIAVLEALARGKPVIGTRVDGIPELIRGRGMAVDSLNENQLADSIIRIASSRADYQEMSEAATAYMETYPDWDRVFRMAESMECAVG